MGNHEISFRIEGVLESTIEVSEKVEICKKSGHLFDKKIVIPYHPRRDVTIQCVNCGLTYERRPTREEILSYQEAAKFEVNI